MELEPVSIRVFLPTGKADGLRTAEIINWSGKALACPRSDIGALLARDELKGPGVYILVGTDPDSGEPAVYVGEAESVATRLKTHQDKDFWVQALVFVSKDENLTKSHIKYLEGELIRRGNEVGKAVLQNSQSSGAKLPEADSADMAAYLRRMYQLLPLLGTSMFEPTTATPLGAPKLLECNIKGLVARGHRTPSGFVVLEGSQAVGPHRPSAKRVRDFRERLKVQGVLVTDGENLRFSRHHEFSSPSAAAAAVRGGNSNGLLNWKDATGKSLRELEESS
jgi:hypothetical protein